MDLGGENLDAEEDFDRIVLDLDSTDPDASFDDDERTGVAVEVPEDFKNAFPRTLNLMQIIDRLVSRLDETKISSDLGEALRDLEKVFEMEKASVPPESLVMLRDSLEAFQATEPYRSNVVQSALTRISQKLRGEDVEELAGMSRSPEYRFTLPQMQIFLEAVGMRPYADKPDAWYVPGRDDTDDYYFMPGKTKFWLKQEVRKLLVLGISMADITNACTYLNLQVANESGDDI